jgi:hypothetical protein
LTHIAAPIPHRQGRKLHFPCAKEIIFNSTVQRGSLIIWKLPRYYELNRQAFGFSTAPQGKLPINLSILSFHVSVAPVEWSDETILR